MLVSLCIKINLKNSLIERYNFENKKKKKKKKWKKGEWKYNPFKINHCNK